jgi:hypothetical protein
MYLILALRHILPLVHDAFILYSKLNMATVRLQETCPVVTSMSLVR